MPVYYQNKESGKIEGKFVGCDTQSVKFRDTSTYERFVSEDDLPLEMTPKTTEPKILETLKLESPNGSVWQLSVDDAGKVTAEKVPKRDA